MAEISVSEALGLSTPESEPDASSDVTPEIREAFNATFGKQDEQAGKGESQRDTSRRRAAEEEEREELEGMDGVSSEDDGDEDFGSEPDGSEGAGETGVKPSRDTDRRAEKDDASDGGSTLSPILRQAAKRNGWTDEQIDEFVEKDEAFALQTFGRISASVNDLTMKYAQLGQVHEGGPPPRRSASAAPPRVPRPRQQQAQRDDDDDLLDEIYDADTLDTLREELGKDVVGKLLTPLLAPVRQLYADAEQRQMDAVAAETGKFFTGLPGEYDDLYGSGNQVSDEQFQTRGKLAELADRVRSGAASQGEDLTVGDALEQANMLIAAKHIGKLERKRLTAKVRKRSRQRTHRPTQRSRRGASGSDKPRGDEAALDAATEMFAELGIR